MSEEVYQRLRQQIIFGDLKVGTPLSRRSLASGYKVSMIPVMEALQRLEGEGLVEVWPRVGTRVRVPSAQDIRDQFVLREALEIQGARIYAERSTADEHEELLGIARRLDSMDSEMEETGEANRHAILVNHHRLHMRLHGRVIELSQCPPFIKAFETNQALVFKWLLDLFPWLTRPQKGHERLIETMSKADPDGAEHAMRAHVRAGLARLLSAIEGFYLNNGSDYPLSYRSRV